MHPRHLRPLVPVILAALLAAGCSARPAPTVSPPGAGWVEVSPKAAPASTSPAPTAATAGSPTASREASPRRVDIAGSAVRLACQGTGSPTVMLEAGLDSSGSVFDPIATALAPTVRACWYDRPGVGGSEALKDADALSVGDRVDELRAVLEAAGLRGPFVLAGHSYGGMVVRLFASRYPEDTAGLVLIDASHEDQFQPGSWWDRGEPWVDGLHPVDQAASRAQLIAERVPADLPIVVLTSGRMTGDFEREWSRLQDALAGLSANAVHMVATDADHLIMQGRPDLVRDAILATVTAARTGQPLAPCGPALEKVGAECLSQPLVEQIAAWDAARSAFRPRAGRLPAGRYELIDDGATVTIDLRDGRLKVEIRDPAGTVESFPAEYAASGRQVVIRWPFDSRMPRTPGLNAASWTVGVDGDLRFEQQDDEPREPWLAVPWRRIRD